MKKPPLKLLNNKTLPEESTFFRSCPLFLSFLPEKPCPKGAPIYNKAKIQSLGSCAWSITLEKYNYCFWTYVSKASEKNGIMKEHTNSEIARILGIPSNKASVEIEEAFEALKILFIKHKTHTYIK